MSWTFTQEELEKHDEMLKEQIYKDLMEHKILMKTDDIDEEWKEEFGSEGSGEYVIQTVVIADVLGQFNKDC